MRVYTKKLKSFEKSLISTLKQLISPQNYYAGIAQLVEHQLPKLRVAGPNPVSRSIKDLLKILIGVQREFLISGASGSRARIIQ